MNNVRPEHNTYLIVGEAKDGVTFAYHHSEETLAVSPKGNPDFWHGTYAQFTIEESRMLKALQSTKPFGPRRVIIVETLTMTTEAQQAILKLSEELAAEIFLFIIVPTVAQLLPTLRSRFAHIALAGGKEADDSAGEAFLSGAWDKRVKAIERVTKEKDTTAAYALLLAVERALLGAKKRDHAALETVLIAKRRVLEGVVPLKMALESAALGIPRRI